MGCEDISIGFGSVHDGYIKALNCGVLGIFSFPWSFFFVIGRDRSPPA